MEGIQDTADKVPFGPQNSPRLARNLKSHTITLRSCSNFKRSSRFQKINLFIVIFVQLIQCSDGKLRFSKNTAFTSLTHSPYTHTITNHNNHAIINKYTYILISNTCREIKDDDLKRVKRARFARSWSSGGWEDLGPKISIIHNTHFSPDQRPTIRNIEIFAACK